MTPSEFVKRPDFAVRLLDVGRALVANLDSEAVLERILAEARELTGARYAALGVLNESRTELERFLTAGLDPAVQQQIGDLPRGRGVLGVLIEDPRPLRLSDVGRHPKSYGFPAAHPPMRSFLGTPITIRGQAWGNLYLTDKQDASGEDTQFTEADEQAVVVLAEWAAIAIENARLFERSELGRLESERAVHSLQAARDIAEAAGAVPELERILELIAKRGRALLGARAILIMLVEDDKLVVRASAGYVSDAGAKRLPISGSTAGQVLLTGAAERFDDARVLGVSADTLGIEHARTALLAPMLYRGGTVGVLAAFDRGEERLPFTATDERLLSAFAASAANAVAIRQSVEADRLRSAIDSAEAERGRWARELHDQTLQALGGLRVMLSTAGRQGGADVQERAIGSAIEEIDSEIANLRGIINDLRPAMLDDLGLEPAIEALVERVRGAGVAVECTVDLGAAPRSLPQDLQTTVYRIVQEALTNVTRHSGAERVVVTVRAGSGRVARWRSATTGAASMPTCRVAGSG